MKQNPKRNLLTIRHIFAEFFGKGEDPGCQQFVASGIHVHLPPSWQVLHDPELKGRDTVKRVDQEFEQAFEFMKVTIGDTAACQNKVFIRWECGGVHKGDFFHLYASHRDFSLSGQSIYLFDEGGQINEIWHAWDTHSLLKDLDRYSPLVPSCTNGKTDLLLKKTSHLTAREWECLHLLLEGKTAKESAVVMNLSPRTIEYYFENIKNKLDCWTKRDLYAFCRLLEKHNIFTRAGIARTCTR